jgi:hypothetical protein
MPEARATRLLKPGPYDYDADRGQIRGFDKAVVKAGERRLEWKSGHELSPGAPGQLRSRYLAEANGDAARRYITGWEWGRGW